jgi:excisionase family DNA binding protein
MYNALEFVMEQRGTHRKETMQLLTVEQVAEILQLSRSKVYDLKDKIGHYKVGGSVRFAEGDVLQFIDGCKVNGKGARRPVPRPRLKHIKA